MVAFGQVASTSQFYFYGRKYCTQTGYQKARRQLLKQGPDELESADLAGKVCMVTGANSGVGMEIAGFLASKGATLYMVCRSATRGEEARKQIVEKSGNAAVSLLVCDCSLESDVRKMWREFSAQGAEGDTLPRLDVIVCNAGVLLNERTLTSEGVEMTLACHLLFGTYLLGSLALPALQATAGSRMVVVSSGGMYNTKFPGWDTATGADGSAYSGNLAYAYAKRGQVLLCEQWSAQFPTVKFVTCHPGWALTPAVDAAYGDMKKYLEPMRTPWEGADGIVWLCTTDASALESGAFYLDRQVCTKHLAGAFFSEGSFTKNSPAEVSAMVERLEAWANGRRLPAEEEAAEAAARALPLRESASVLDIPKFMGKWYVHAQVPSMFDRGAMNSTEDYSWNVAKERIDVSFKMQMSKEAAVKQILQRCTIANPPTNTRWSLSPKFGGVFLPLGLPSLIVYFDEDYSTCVVSTPDRSLLYIMGRGPTMEPAVLNGLIERSRRLGHDSSKIDLVLHDYSVM